MDTIMMTTELTDREVEIIADMRKTRQQINAFNIATGDQEEWFNLNQRMKVLEDEFRRIKRAKDRAARAVQELNYKPTVDVKVFRAFLPAGILTSIITAIYGVLSQDLKAETLPMGLGITLSGVLFTFYFLGYICRKR